MSTLISTSSEWTFPLLEQFDHHIAQCAKEHGLDTYPNQIEVISSDQMLDAYASNGMPVMYPHWSYGKNYLSNQKQYLSGNMNLAYEIVINSSPCIAYLMEANSLPMQALVIAHACYGHNAFFKGNYLFRQFTDAEGIIDYLVFARNYVMACEERYGYDEVASILDACHSLQNYGVDRYKKVPKKNLASEASVAGVRARELKNNLAYTELQSTLPKLQRSSHSASASKRYPEEPQENILYFIEKNSPVLEPWQRELVRIVRIMSQYFYPQMHTKVMNEGFATFWHYQLIYDLYNKGLVNDGFMLEFLESHTSVVNQPSYKRTSSFNPYALGFSMYQDIRRICQNPTDEDREWFPQFAGKDWHETIDFAMRNFKDESFIAQYLSPTLMRKMRMFTIHDNSINSEYIIGSIHDEMGYRHLRQNLSENYVREYMIPPISVYEYRRMTDRNLVLRHYRYQNRTLDHQDAKKVLADVKKLWGFTVFLESVDHHDKVMTTWNS